ncbi:hydroxypyruvate isomerase family protein [Arenibacterium halophilum]|uniref:TIM barrel protein n=1 Tax=Arenibacterium halophilum TaxID=2583821 RepID=A0ABY2X8E7_9RHOB|nr:TIM barrel protein [Arenibacterium halophilum]TMV12646.1 TIM barrel protein [Arenibacterium halophilum]
MKLIANISMMFTEVALAQRLDQARAAGFEGVEIQFPDDADIAPLQAAIRDTGLPVVLINVPRGPGDAVGLASLPGEEPAFARAVETCARQAKALGVRKVNVLAGRPPEGADPAACRATLVANLRHAAEVFAGIGVRVMVEPVNPGDVPGFFLPSLGAALSVLNEAAHDNLALQFDLYHMEITEPDLLEAIRTAGKRIGHVQFADTPGRHEPGTGTIDFARAFDALRATGYADVVSAEYRPAGATTDQLGWIPDFKRILA